ncbi:hypothetical protein [Paludibacterium sp.]|uniref:hypothetical protein n=1 Tax=Paludibacterium sp. TaxID=1917523 RepID=UPI0025DD3572|nr:hypothetical protein [Paludibacterium sp.]MBV8649686.1 hypothetical protein [Paludibacterium sp.]
MSNRTTKMVGAGVPPSAAQQIAGADVATGLVATGSTQATALAATADTNVFATVAASTGTVIFQGPAAGPGDTQFFFNGGANALSVYPPVSGQINALGANTAFSLAAGKSLEVRCVSSTQFYTILSA